MPDVTIPADVARTDASVLRKFGRLYPSLLTIADRLDPAPPSLREQVADCLVGLPEVRAHQAGLVRAVVADWLAAQPLRGSAAHGHIDAAQRDADVALIRGGAE